MLNWNPLNFADVRSSNRTDKFEYGGEGPPAAGTDSRRLSPLGYARITELMKALETSLRLIVLIEANRAHILVRATSFVLYFCGFLYVNFEGRSEAFLFLRGGLVGLLNRSG